MEDRHYYHAATKGLEADVLFSSREQFESGMNRVAFCRLSSPGVIIIAFVLMDNHIHFVLYGTYSDCMDFINQYKRLTEIWLAHRCPQQKDKKWDYDCWMIRNKESLQDKICYVLRNPLVAGMGMLPTNYLWGSGPLMFAGESRQVWGDIHPIGITSEYQRRKLFGTKMEIPQEWMVTEKGMIWPGSYVEYKRAELAFDGITGFMYGLNSNNEDLINQEMYASEISLHDSDVISILSSRAEEEMGVSDLSVLTIPQKLDLCRIAIKSHGVNLKQLGRILHISYSDLRKIW